MQDPERGYLLLGTKEGERVDLKGLYSNRSSSSPSTMVKFMSVSTGKKKSQKDIPGWNAAELIPTSPGVLLVFMIELLIL